MLWKYNNKDKWSALQEITIKSYMKKHILCLHIPFWLQSGYQLHTSSSSHLSQSLSSDREGWKIRNLSRWASTQSSIVISLLKRKGLAAWSQLAPEVGICESDTVMRILLFSVMSWQLLHCCALIMLDWNCLFDNVEPLSSLVFNFLASLIPHHLP